MRYSVFGSGRVSAGICILLQAAVGGIAAGQVSPTASLQWTVDGGLRDRSQLFVRTALMPSWRGTWGIDHVRVSYASAFPSGGGICYVTDPAHCTRTRGYRSYGAVDIGHSFEMSRSVKRRYQLLLAPGVIYGFGSPDAGRPQFGALVRATVRTTNRLGHGGELHLQLQHGLLQRTTVEIGTGFHLRVWTAG